MTNNQPQQNLGVPDHNSEINIQPLNQPSTHPHTVSPTHTIQLHLWTTTLRVTVIVIFQTNVPINYKETLLKQRHNCPQVTTFCNISIPLPLTGDTDEDIDPYTDTYNVTQIKSTRNTHKRL